MSRQRINGRASAAGEEGFSLVELLVAGAVLAIGVLGTATLAASSESTTLDAELQQVATEQAERQVEFVRSLQYEQVGMNAPPAVPPEGGSMSDNRFSAPGVDDDEEIVQAEDGQATQYVVDPVRTFTVQQGEQSIGGTVYTFISWRNETCVPGGAADVVPVNELTGRLDALKAALANTRVLAGQAKNRLTSTLIGLISEAGTLKDEIVRLEQAIAPLEAEIDSTLDEIAGLSAVDGIDLCDVTQDAFASLTGLLAIDTGSINSIIGTLTSTGGVDDRLREVRDNNDLTTLLGYLGGTTCNNVLTRPLCQALVQPILNNVINPAIQVLQGAPDAVAPADAIDALGDTLTAIGELDVAGLNADTEQNTKRVTVAVTIDTLSEAAKREDLTPKKPVWLGTVVIDPDDGLLGLEVP